MSVGEDEATIRFWRVPSKGVALLGSSFGEADDVKERAHMRYEGPTRATAREKGRTTDIAI